jgi:hypothetical protein
MNGVEGPYNELSVLEAGAMLTFLAGGRETACAKLYKRASSNSLASSSSISSSLFFFLVNSFGVLVFFLGLGLGLVFGTVLGFVDKAGALVVFSLAFWR